jgi:membrane glycosyltransferase
VSGIAPEMQRAYIVRTSALIVSLTLSLAGSSMFAGFIAADGSSALDWVRVTLFFASSFWLVWGGIMGLLGVMTTFPAARPVGRPKGMTAILIPVYNEDPAATFSRVAAMNRSLTQLGLADRFHFAILSDSTSLDVAAAEAVWFEKLMHEFNGEPRLFYRRRDRNTGKKAGNIQDFMVRSGGAYDYALILDADSLMDGATIAAMACRMDADERLGLLQTVPQVIHAKSLFGRLMQFSSAYLAPYFARGSELMAGNEGPYWGHNAIVRVPAFAACCGLPELSGKPPSGGHILSHDYVEAALLARGGWKVQLAPELDGSFEEGPENLVEYAKRDRRWCQGNLQHRRILLAPGLRLWSRFIFVQGIMAYLASPLWLLLVATSILATALPDRGLRGSEAGIWMLAVAVGTTLLLPKLLILIRNALTGQNAGAGGTLRATLSVLGEIVLSTLLAPLLLCFQSRAVFQVLFGMDGGWPATKRSEGEIGVDDAFAASWWIMLVAGIVVAITLAFSPRLLPWLLPVAIPALVAPLLISWTSRSTSKPLLFRTPVELNTPAIVTTQEQIFARWTATEGDERSQFPIDGASYVRA